MRAAWIFVTAPGRFDLKEDPPNSQGILNNSANLTLKRPPPPLLNRVQHKGIKVMIFNMTPTRKRFSLGCLDYRVGPPYYTNCS